MIIMSSGPPSPSMNASKEMPAMSWSGM
jgi:hypothetical protein